MDNKELDNKKHIQNVYVDKAINLLNIFLFLAFISLSSYVVAIFTSNSFDFGLIVELLSFLCVIFASDNLKSNKIQSAKSFVLFSLAILLMLFIYDLINILLFDAEILIYYFMIANWFGFSNPFLIYALIPMLNIGLLIKTYSSICMATGEIKNEDYAENFYDKI